MLATFIDALPLRLSTVHPSKSNNGRYVFVINRSYVSLELMGLMELMTRIPKHRSVLTQKHSKSPNGPSLYPVPSTRYRVQHLLRASVNSE